MDEDFLDLIDKAFLEVQIDGEVIKLYKSPRFSRCQRRHDLSSLPMLTQLYIAALLVNEALADQAWNKGEIDDQMAWLAWWLMTFRPLCTRKRTFR